MSTGAWVQMGYAPVYAGSHPQPGRIVRQTYSGAGFSDRGRLQTLEGFGLGDDSSFGTDYTDEAPAPDYTPTDVGGQDYADPAPPADPTDTTPGTFLDDPPPPSAPAGASNTSAYLSLLGAALKAGGQIAPSAIQAYTIAARAAGYDNSTINQMIALAQGNAKKRIVASGGTPAGSSTTLILLVAAALAAVFLLKGSR